MLSPALLPKLCAIMSANACAGVRDKGRVRLSPDRQACVRRSATSKGVRRLSRSRKPSSVSQGTGHVLVGRPAAFEKCPC